MTNIFEHDFFADYDWDHLTSGRGQPDTIKPPYLPPPHSDLKVGHSSLHTVIEEKNTQSLHPLYIFRCHALTTHPLNTAHIPLSPTLSISATHLPPHPPTPPSHAPPTRVDIKQLLLPRGLYPRARRVTDGTLPPVVGHAVWGGGYQGKTLTTHPLIHSFTHSHTLSYTLLHLLSCPLT